MSYIFTLTMADTINKTVGPKNKSDSKPASFIVCSHVNLNRKETANIDTCLMAEYLLNKYHINEHGVDLGLEIFAPDFNYNYRDRDSSIERVRND